MMKKWDFTEVIEQIEVLQSNDTFIVADIETTGFNPKKGAEITQIAAVKVVNGLIVERFNTYVKTKKSIPFKITELTGITDDMVKHAPKVNMALWALKGFAGNDVFVFHNASFDWVRFLNPMMAEAGIPTNNTVFCTYETFRKVAPGLGKGKYTNAAMSKLFGFDLVNAHSADADVEATAASLVGLKTAFDKIDVTAIKEEKEKQESTQTPVNIKSINYWEKTVTDGEGEKKQMKRQYVNVEGTEGKGTVFYDFVRKIWGNKNYPGKLRFKDVEQAIFEKLNIQTVDEFEGYRNATN